MKPSMSLTGEHESHKVAAVFETESDANGTAKALCNETSLTNEQVSVLSPADRRQGKELEPEDQGIWQTLVRSHVGLSVGGAVSGFVVYVILNALGIGFISQNTVVSASALPALGLMLGLLLAGGITIRSDHTPYLMKAQSALRKGHYVLAIHAESTQQIQEAKSLLRARNVKTVQTL